MISSPGGALYLWCRRQLERYNSETVHNDELTKALILDVTLPHSHIPIQKIGILTIFALFAMKHTGNLLIDHDPDFCIIGSVANTQCEWTLSDAS